MQQTKEADAERPPAPGDNPKALDSLAMRVAALEREVALLGITEQLRQALRRIAALEAK